MGGQDHLGRNVMAVALGIAALVALFVAAWTIQDEALGLSLALMAVIVIAPCIALAFTSGEERGGVRLAPGHSAVYDLDPPALRRRDRVLIVDDDPDICLAMRSLLQGEGWETEEAKSGQEALQRLDELPEFDVMVLDYKMPGLTGIQLARSLREEGILPPTIMYSAYLNPQIKEEAKTLGMPTVSKTDFHRLMDMIRQDADPAAVAVTAC